MEKCNVCGGIGSKTLYAWNSLGEVREVPVCEKCYGEVEPILVKRSLVFRRKKRVSHIGYAIWKIESRSIAGFIEKAGRTVIGRIMAKISVISIPLVFISTIVILLSLLDRLLNPLRYVWFAKTLPKGAMAINIPGVDPAIPLIQGWIALMVTVSIHEFAHGVASTWLGSPPRGAGIMLFLGLPLAAYVDINSSPFEKGSWRFTGASLAANLTTSAIALAILAVIGMPEIYVERPSLLLIPPEVARYLGIDIKMSFIQSLLAWVFLANLWLGAVFNSLPLLITDGYYILVSALHSITGRNTAKPVFALSIVLLLSISITFIVERVIIPYF